MRKPTQSIDMRRRVPDTARLEPAAVIAEPADRDATILSRDDSAVFHHHQLEQEVRRRLMAEPSLNFNSLVVRRVRNGLCLEGVLETSDDAPDVSRLVRGISGVSQVLDHLVIHRRHELPRKG